MLEYCIFIEFGDIEMSEINNERLKESTFSVVLQSLAVIIFIVLLIVDKGLDLMAKPIPDLWYGVIGAFGIGGIDLIKSLVNKGK